MHYVEECYIPPPQHQAPDARREANNRQGVAEELQHVGSIADGDIGRGPGENLTSQGPPDTKAVVLSLSFEDQLMLRIAFALAIYCTAVSVDAAMMFNFKPAYDGGVRLTAHFNDTLTMQVIDPRFCNVSGISGELLKGGSSARDSYRFADLINETIITDGKSLELEYVRFGNHVSRDSLAFYMSNNRVVTGSDVQIDFVAEWRVNNLAYSLMIPGTYTAFAAPYGQTIVTVAAVPEPASIAMLICVTGVGLVSRQLRHW